MVEGENLLKTKSSTEIQSFFSGRSVFITGVTGFLGHVLLVKLLRSCPDVRRIFVLIRPKRGKTPCERFEGMCENTVFKDLEKEMPDFMNRIKPLAGDCEKLNLGLSESDKTLLERECGIIFHIAATVKFDAPLRDAINMNVKATKSVIELARNMTSLKVLVHVSTAFSNCTGRDTIEEKFYDPPIPAESLMAETDQMDDELLERMTPIFMGKYPNSYVYTKCVAENMVKNMGKGLPIVVFRPAIVISSAIEPLPGWINNAYGPSGIVVASCLGLLRTMIADKHKVANVVPCDYVINSMIAAAWSVSAKMNTNSDGDGIRPDDDGKDEATRHDIPIFNYSNDRTQRNGLTWKRYMDLMEENESVYPFSFAMWAYIIFLVKDRKLHKFLCLFLHIIPAYIIDKIAKLVGKEPKLMAAYDKIHKLMDVLSYFSLREWRIPNDNVYALWSLLSAEDKKLFYFDLNQIDFQYYCKNHFLGIRKYVLNDKEETLEPARRRRRRFLYAHYVAVSLLAGSLVYCLFLLLRIVTYDAHI